MSKLIEEAVRILGEQKSQEDWDLLQKVLRQNMTVHLKPDQVKQIQVNVGKLKVDFRWVNPSDPEVKFGGSVAAKDFKPANWITNEFKTFQAFVTWIESFKFPSFTKPKPRPGSNRPSYVHYD